MERKEMELVLRSRKEENILTQKIWIVLGSLIKQMIILLKPFLLNQTIQTHLILLVKQKRMVLPLDGAYIEFL